MDGVQGLVLVIGDQLWDDLDLLARWSHSLTDVAIVPLHGDQGTGSAVERLSDFLARHHPRVTVHVMGPVHDNEPREVCDAVRQAAARLPAASAVNASGCAQLVFLGALWAVQESDSLHLLHVVHGEPWHSISSSGEVRELPQVVDALEHVPVVDLLAVTWGDPERQVQVLPRTPPQVMVRAARATVNGGSWSALFQNALRSREMRTLHMDKGFAFELFMLALLLELGLQPDAVCLSAKLIDDGKYVQEVDLVVNQGGRLHVIDCKYTRTAHAPIGMQIREADTTRRHLADGAGQVILLRPLKSYSEEVLSLCAMHDLRMVDRSTLERRRLPHVIGGLLRCG